MNSGYIDPFGAPEFLVHEIGPREMICGELVMLPWCAVDGRDRILKVKLLVPLPVLLAERSKTAEFLTAAKSTLVIPRLMLM